MYSMVQCANMGAARAEPAGEMQGAVVSCKATQPNMYIYIYIYPPLSLICVYIYIYINIFRAEPAGRRR